MRRFLISCFGVMAAFLVLFAIGIAGLVFLLKSETTTKITENTVLKITMRGSLQEQTTDNSIEELLEWDNRSVKGVYNLKKVIEGAKDDENIRGIHLDLDNFGAGLVVIEELRHYLADFKKSNKWIIAHATHLSLSGYYLATAADKIYLNPEGDVTFNGLSVYIMFYKKMLDKLKIKTDVFRVGAYKSAVEPFMREKLSDESRRQYELLLQSVESNLMKQIAKSRKIPEERLKNLSDSAKIQTAYNALTYGLIDATLYRSELKSELKKRLNIDEEEDINTITYNAYRKTLSQHGVEKQEGRIAVIVAEGGIEEGKSDSEKKIVGAVSISKALEKAYKNDRVKAVVMRINSPGGSFIASDKIWHAVKRVAAKKPVIASMSNYAASGGYYIASACNTIVAQPNTITGSIGVFGLHFDASGFLKDKIGITGEEVKTGLLSNVRTVAPMSDLAKSIWQSRTDSVYKTFVGKVALSRKKMTFDQILAVAGGRVWTGSQAKGNGLVDVLGSYSDALSLAAKKAGLEEYSVDFYNRPKNFFERIVERISDVKANQFVQSDATYMLYRQWQQLKALQGIQARMPFEYIEGAAVPSVQQP